MEFKLRNAKTSKLEHWTDAFYWFILSSVGGILPFWGALVVLLAISRQFTSATFFQNGEFALYSASMLSAAFTVVTKKTSEA